MSDGFEFMGRKYEGHHAVLTHWAMVDGGYDPSAVDQIVKAATLQLSFVFTNGMGAFPGVVLTIIPNESRGAEGESTSVCLGPDTLLWLGGAISQAMAVFTGAIDPKTFNIGWLSRPIETTVGVPVEEGREDGGHDGERDV